MKKVLNRRVLFGVFLLILSKGAMATCGFISGTTYTVNDSSSFSFGTIVLDRNTPVGTVVASSTNTDLSGRGNFLQCTYEPFSPQWALGSGAYTPVLYAGETLYQSGVEGLAFRIVTPGAGSTAGKYGTGALPRTIGSLYCVTSGTWYRLCGGTWGSPKLELVKIAPITRSGPLTTGSIVQALLVGDINVMNYMITAGTVQTTSCSVVNPNIVVNLGKVRKSEFSGQNTPSISQTAFSIDLNCDASTNLTLTIDPGSAGSPNMGRGLLSLDSTNGDKASGVAVQILYNGKDLQLGATNPFIVFNTGGGGLVNIPLVGRYFQIASTTDAIFPGIANANATFTMTYQ